MEIELTEFVEKLFFGIVKHPQIKINFINKRQDMKIIKSLSTIFLLVSACSIANAQWPRPTNSGIESMRQQREAGNRRDRETIQTPGNTPVRKNRAETNQAVIPKITDEGKKMVSINPEVKNQYKEFLKMSNTGVVKLFPNRCSKDKYTTNDNVVLAGEGCFDSFIPGGGNSFSFRTKLHTLNNLSDLELGNEKFKISGQLIQGILVSLGDVPIESIGYEHEAMRFITQFIPGGDRTSAVKQSKDLEKGFQNGEFSYARSQPVKNNTTYLLRSSAYRIEPTDALAIFGYYSGKLFNADKRKDVVIAFRVVAIENDGSVIVLWRELSRKDPISLNLNKDKQK